MSEGPQPCLVIKLGCVAWLFLPGTTCGWTFDVLSPKKHLGEQVPVVPAVISLLQVE